MILIIIIYIFIGDFWILLKTQTDLLKHLIFFNKNSLFVGLLVSQYIAKPHLIKGYKYDIRLYVLVSGVDPLKVKIEEKQQKFNF